MKIDSVTSFALKRFSLPPQIFAGEYRHKKAKDDVELAYVRLMMMKPTGSNKKTIIAAKKVLDLAVIQRRNEMVSHRRRFLSMVRKETIEAVCIDSDVSSDEEDRGMFFFCFV